MINKYLENKIALDLSDNCDNSNNRINLEYYLLESENHEMDGLEGKKVYGIEIVKRLNDKNSESEIIRNFSNCKENTEEVLNKLAINTVTPIGLAFILDDMIGI